VGLYRLDPDERLYKDELVLAQPPRWAGQLASTRGYLPLGVPLIKHVVALPGDCVCARASAIIVNGSRLAGALSRDHAGRVLPRWTGCNVLDSDRLLLLNATVRDSFDGRYFGISRRADVLGRLEPLWLP
jgi:conjugative transfer signal peptidase TraF